MESQVNVMVGGEAGQGVQSVDFILAKTFAGGLSRLRRPGLRVQGEGRAQFLPGQGQ